MEQASHKWTFKVVNPSWLIAWPRTSDDALQATINHIWTNASSEEGCFKLPEGLQSVARELLVHMS
jgi:hypothetical protein